MKKKSYFVEQLILASTFIKISLFVSNYNSSFTFLEMLVSDGIANNAFTHSVSPVGIFCANPSLLLMGLRRVIKSEKLGNP